MVFRSAEWWNHSVGKTVSCWLPALLCWVLLWRVLRKVLEPHSLFVSLKILFDFCSFVRFCIVNKKQEFFPSSSKSFQEHNEFSLSFLPREWEDEALWASRAKHICVFVGVINFYKWVTSASSPSPRDDWNKAERCLILRAHNKSFRSIVSCLLPSFFLNCCIASSLGHW